jgi:hypothetical protein
MKKWIITAGMAAIAPFLLLKPSLAAELPLNLKKAPVASTIMPLKQPLKQPLQLSPSLKVQAKTPRVMLPVKLNQLNQQFNEMYESAAEYEVGVTTMPQIQQQCADKSYSIQDQIAAGCNGNETLNQCMEKLVAHCMATFTASGISWGGIGNIPGGSTPSFSTTSFRQAAEKTAAKARVLSQKLQQYASQAERNAAAWK